MSIFAGETSALASGTFPMVPIGSLFVERSERGDAADYPPLSVGKMGVTPQLENVAKAADTSNRKLARHGDIVINSRSDRRGASGLAPADGTVSVVYTVLDPGPLVDRAYVHHMIRSAGFQEEYYRFGTGIVDDLWSTRYDRLATIRVPLPSLEVQRRVAGFLDRELAEIDAMDAELNHLIVILQERRAAAIDSLLAPFPRVALQWGWSVTDCLHKTASVVEGGERYVVSIGQLHAPEVDVSSAPVTTPEDFDSLRGGGRSPKVGDAVMSRNASVGKLSLVTDRTPPFALGQDVVLLSPEAGGSASLLSYCMQSRASQDALDLAMIGTTFKRINVAAIKQLPWVWVSEDEQQQLVTALDEQTVRIDDMIADTKRLKKLLAERRSTLITDVVTGKKEVPA